MRIVVQRTRAASVEVAGAIVGKITRGIVALVGIEDRDGAEDLRWAADKLAHLRIFEDAQGKLNRSLLDLPSDEEAGVLLVPNFTVAGDATKGRRPSFDRAKRPEESGPMFVRLAEMVREHGVRVETGVFRTEMLVRLENDGPITLVLESPARS